ncbi:polyprenyl synthetase family protein [Thiomonas sp. FB-6]|uniref:polyprenyl synthetase family protein n=1 Tax=Thiomonas sp. FB-6 TaxID=1158291 RepID=UPI000366DE74|nr:polyprenyl synthetase family protein [Thiomonas sp. FB-6]
MLEVDASIRRALASEVPLISAIGSYIVGAGGKRLRPALLLLVARAHGYAGEHLHDLAAVVEMIHTATLLHDDVVDESELRRGRQTSNAAYGNAASVLSGDFLYSRSFQMMVAAGELRILRILADATNVIAEGEVLQLMNMHDPEITSEQYMRVIHDKTAALFEAAARIGAVLAGCDAAAEQGAAGYGRSIGLAFQLIDDALDYNGNAEEMGKNVGDDLREGKPTLPLIVAMQRAQGEQRELIQRAIREGDTDSLPSILEVVRSCEALDEVYAVARTELNNARGLAQAMPEGPFRDSLLALCDYSLQRNA